MTSSVFAGFARWHKKAMTLGFIVSIVITIVAFVLISAVIYRSYAAADDKAAENICRDSVLLRGTATLGVGSGEDKGEVRLTPLLCKTLDKEFSGSREKVKEDFANAISRCWWMFGEGRYSKDILSNVEGIGGASQCFVCYVAVVEDSSEFKEGESIPAGEFDGFIRSTTHPIYNGTYLDYIQRTGGIVVGVLTEQGIAPGRAYAIAYKSKRDSCAWCGEIAGVGALGALGGAGSAFLGYRTGSFNQLKEGAAATIGGIAASVYGIKELVYYAIFKEIDVNSVYVVDLSDVNMKKFSTEYCGTVREDIAGR